MKNIGQDPHTARVLELNAMYRMGICATLVLTLSSTKSASVHSKKNNHQEKKHRRQFPISSTNESSNSQLIVTLMELGT